MSGFTEIRVELGDRSYPILVGEGVLDTAARSPGAGLPRRLLIVTHPRLWDLYGTSLARTLATQGCTVEHALVPAGETSKSLSMVNRLYRVMASAGLDRSSAVIALGGGVIGDLAGFASATWLRGIDVIQVPTTLLAMVDSAIGGKTGVNLPFGKNLVGAFHQPRAVWIDPCVLRSLPARDIRSGMGEVVKYGVIAKPGLFEFLEDNVARCLALEPAAEARMIADSASCKAEVVSADEREGGLRAILNYGHTAGHAVEKVAGYRRVRHGEAVAIGMVVAAKLGERIGMTPPDVSERLERLLVSARLPVRVPAGLPVGPMVEAMRLDKKASSGMPRWVIARGIGHVEPGVEIPESLVVETLCELGADAKNGHTGKP
jgi:3-dehydroquinate synthase